MDGNDSSTNTSNIPQITKTIYLIRHGVAVHNVHDPNTNERPNYFDPALTDPPLIRQGEVQASVLGENMKRMGLAAANSNNDDGMDIDNQHQAIQSPPPPIELVVCSPLTRCLQTASRIFPTYFQSSPPSQHDSVSEAISEDGDAQPFVLSEDCKVCCHGDVREAFGKHYPDRRSPLSHIKSKYPTVTYHPSITEHDTVWEPHTRETRLDVTIRVHKFFTWLLHQPHDNIAIVSHGAWMECALTKYCPEVLDHGKKRVYNCEVYSGKLAGRTEMMDEKEFKDVKQIVFYNA